MNRLILDEQGGEVAAPEGAPVTVASAGPGFPLRGWLSLAGILVIVGFAGYLLWDRFAGSALTSDSRDLVEIVPLRGPRAWSQPPPVRPDGVRPRGSNGYQVKAGDALLNATRVKEGGWTLEFRSERPPQISPDDDAALTARFRLPRDAAFAKSLNVTAEQIKQLNRVPSREGMVASDGDRARISILLDEYAKAADPRDTQTEALLNALREVAAGAAEPTRNALAERAEQVRSILTAEQIAKFKRGAN